MSRALKEKAPVETGAIQNPKPLNFVKLEPFLIIANFFYAEFKL
jgi:hypothetical protein